VLLTGLVACAAPRHVDAVSSPTRKTLWAQKSEHKLALRWGDELFTELRHEEGSIPGLFPLFAPGGIPVSPVQGPPQEGEPAPRALWLAHGDVDGVDFWNVDAEGAGVIVHPGRLEEILHRGKTLRVTYDFEWRGSDGTPLLAERRRMLFGGEERERWIDLELTFTPLAEEVRFGDTGAGTLALLLHPDLRAARDTSQEAGGEDGVGDDSSAAEQEEQVDTATPQGRAAWMHRQGEVQGSEVGIALFEHPTNFRHPTWWQVSDEGLLAANPFGVHDTENLRPGAGNHVLASGEELVLRYRVWIHLDPKTPDEVAGAFRVYLAHVPAK